MRLPTTVNKMSHFGVIHNKISFKGFCSLVNALGYVDVSCPNGSSSSTRLNQKWFFRATKVSAGGDLTHGFSLEFSFRLPVTALWNYENFIKTRYRQIKILRARPFYHVSVSLYLNGSFVCMYFLLYTD